MGCPYDTFDQLKGSRILHELDKDATRGMRVYEDDEGVTDTRLGNITDELVAQSAEMLNGRMQIIYG